MRKRLCGPFPGDERGQAVVEYILMIVTVLAVALVLQRGLRKSVYGLWESISRDVSAACPGCPASSQVRISR